MGSCPPALTMPVGALWSSRTERNMPDSASPAGVVALAAALACPADPPAGGAAFPAAMFFAVPARRARRRALAGFPPMRLAASSAAMAFSASCCYRVHPRLAGLLDQFNAGRRRWPPPSRRGCASDSPCADTGVRFSPRGFANSAQAWDTGLFPPEAVQDSHLSSRVHD